MGGLVELEGGDVLDARRDHGLVALGHGDDRDGVEDDADEERAMFELQARILGDWTAQTGREKIRTPVPGAGGEVRA